jgi:hypothetical protein
LGINAIKQPEENCELPAITQLLGYKANLIKLVSHTPRTLDHDKIGKAAQKPNRMEQFYSGR